MNIYEAAQKLKLYRYIKRKDWEGFIYVSDNNILLYKYPQSEKIIEFTLRLNDLLADDWEVVNLSEYR
jgi:hypothetical protein